MSNSSALTFQEQGSSSSTRLWDKPKCYIKDSNNFPVCSIQANLVFSYSFSSWLFLIEISPLSGWILFSPNEVQELTQCSDFGEMWPFQWTSQGPGECVCPEGRAGRLHCAVLCSPAQQRGLTTLPRLFFHPIPTLLCLRSFPTARVMEEPALFTLSFTTQGFYLKICHWRMERSIHL